MGGWTFMEPRLRALGADVKYVGRDASASPATGSRHVHVREQKEIVQVALAGPAPHLVRSIPDTQARRVEVLKAEPAFGGEPQATVNRASSAPR